MADRVSSYKTGELLSPRPDPTATASIRFLSSTAFVAICARIRCFLSVGPDLGISKQLCKVSKKKKRVHSHAHTSGSIALAYVYMRGIDFWRRLHQ